MRAIWRDITIADSDETVVVEGNHYFPAASVNEDVLISSAMKSLCPWKGLASYYHAESGDAHGRNVAWTYRHPYPWIRRSETGLHSETRSRSSPT